MRTRPVSKRHDYRSLRVFQFLRGLKCIIRRGTPRHYKNDELTNESESRVTNEFANEFARYFSSSTVADAKKPDLRAEKMTRAGKIQTYRNVRNVRWARCRVACKFRQFCDGIEPPLAKKKCRRKEMSKDLKFESVLLSKRTTNPSRRTVVFLNMFVFLKILCALQRTLFKAHLQSVAAI